MSGYRTYIVAALMAINSAIFGMGFIDRNAYEMIMGLLVSAGAATMRSGMKSETQEVKEEIKVETRGIAETPKRDPGSGQYQSRKE